MKFIILKNITGIYPLRPQDAKVLAACDAGKELKTMFNRLSSIKCPACKKEIVRNKIIRIPNQSKLEIVQKEIQCPLCNSRLIMDQGSQKRAKSMLFLGLIASPAIISLSLEHLNLVTITPNWVKTAGITTIFAFIAYVFFIFFTIRYKPKSHTDS